MCKNVSWMKLPQELNIKTKILNENKTIEYKWTRIEFLLHIGSNRKLHGLIKQVILKSFVTK